jgi:hypothetical protein
MRFPPDGIGKVDILVVLIGLLALIAIVSVLFARIPG